MISAGVIRFEDGMLKVIVPELGEYVFRKPAALAESRFKCLPPQKTIVCETGGDLLLAAFTVIPFVQAPVPMPIFGTALTPAACEGFSLFLGGGESSDDFRVLRGEPDDFLVCARRFGVTWKAAAFTTDATTLTFRFEDLRDLTPPTLHAPDYILHVVRDPHPGERESVIRESFDHIAPDARICVDLAANGGFLFTFTPTPKIL